MLFLAKHVGLAVGSPYTISRLEVEFSFCVCDNTLRGTPHSVSVLPLFPLLWYYHPLRGFEEIVQFTFELCDGHPRRAGD